LSRAFAGLARRREFLNTFALTVLNFTQFAPLVMRMMAAPWPRRNRHRAGLDSLRRQGMKNWFLWMIAGLISLLGGFFALANPLAATLTAELLAGWMFVAVGVMTMVSAFGDQGWGGRILSLLIGLVILALGIDLIANPLAGVVSLTLVIGIGLVVMGVLRILLAAGSEFAGLRLVLCMSGAISLLLGAMILSNFPQSAALVLGVYLAVELISNGISLIVLSLARKSDPEVA
jgi:uncharacterized membrane protein HdeD (DUF308 family)